MSLGNRDKRLDYSEMPVARPALHSLSMDRWSSTDQHPLCFNQQGDDCLSLSAAPPGKPRAILTADQVLEIFRCKPASLPSGFKAVGCTAVARRFGVDEKTVRDIWKGHTWSEVTRPYDPARPAKSTAQRQARKRDAWPPSVPRLQTVRPSPGKRQWRLRPRAFPKTGPPFGNWQKSSTDRQNRLAPTAQPG